MRATLALTLLLCFAPAPFPRHQRARPADLAGDWRLDWGTSVYSMRLSPDGSYVARPGWGTMTYAGVWTLRHGRVYVTEWPTFLEGAAPTSWSVRPDCAAQVMPNGMAVGMRR